ncbi:hypothetical protein MKX03_035373, partial [Papaver bracteatum]
VLDLYLKRIIISYIFTELFHHWLNWQKRFPCILCDGKIGYACGWLTQGLRADAALFLPRMSVNFA